MNWEQLKQPILWALDKRCHILRLLWKKKKKFCVYDKKYADCKREEKEPVKLLQVFFFFCCLFCFDLAWRPIDFLLFSVVIIILKPWTTEEWISITSKGINFCRWHLSKTCKSDAFFTRFVIMNKQKLFFFSFPNKI